MRHGKKFNHLGRKVGHRKALLSNLGNALVEHKRIKTTLAKGRALRKFIEPIITRAKEDTTHNRRMVFKYLQSKNSVKELFGDIASKVVNRPGGYVRILKLGSRLGDAAEMCYVELVDYNANMLETSAAKPKKKRSRRGGKKSTTENAPTVDQKSAPEASTEAAE